jgi:hypothetical protein
MDGLYFHINPSSSEQWDGDLMPCDNALFYVKKFACYTEVFYFLWSASEKEKFAFILLFLF